MCRQTPAAPWAPIQATAAQRGSRWSEASSCGCGWRGLQTRAQLCHHYLMRLPFRSERKRKDHKQKCTARLSSGSAAALTSTLALSVGPDPGPLLWPDRRLCVSCRRGRLAVSPLCLGLSGCVFRSPSRGRPVLLDTELQQRSFSFNALNTPPHGSWPRRLCVELAAAGGGGGRGSALCAGASSQPSGCRLPLDRSLGSVQVRVFSRVS